MKITLAQLDDYANAAYFLALNRVRRMSFVDPEQMQEIIRLAKIGLAFEAHRDRLREQYEIHELDRFENEGGFVGQEA